LKSGIIRGKLPLKVTKTAEETMATNEIKYKIILNHQGNANDVDLLWEYNLFSVKSLALF
jgi:hypothetical protein